MPYCRCLFVLEWFLVFVCLLVRVCVCVCLSVCLQAYIKKHAHVAAAFASFVGLLQGIGRLGLS